MWKSKGGGCIVVLVVLVGLLIGQLQAVDYKKLGAAGAAALAGAGAVATPDNGHHGAPTGDLADPNDTHSLSPVGTAIHSHSPHTPTALDVVFPHGTAEELTAIDAQHLAKIEEKRKYLEKNNKMVARAAGGHGAFIALVYVGLEVNGTVVPLPYEIELEAKRYNKITHPSATAKTDHGVAVVIKDGIFQWANKEVWHIGVSFNGKRIGEEKDCKMSFSLDHLDATCLVKFNITLTQDQLPPPASPEERSPAVRNSLPPGFKAFAEGLEFAIGVPKKFWHEWKGVTCGYLEPASQWLGWIEQTWMKNTKPHQNKAGADGEEGLDGLDK